ncbi:MAG: aspartate kinase [Planctomycetota bacterium]
MQLPGIVMKFGGTSVESAAAIRAAAAIVLRVLPRRPLVVVSAASGVTDALLRLLEAAPRGEWHAGLKLLVARHRAILADLGLATNLLDARFQELHDLCHGIELLREVTPRISDLFVASGELLLAPIFAAHLSGNGVVARAWHAGDLGLVTDDRFGRARPVAETYQRIPATLAETDEHLAVVTGFAGRTATGEATTLGRGGSDYSASIFARAVNAEELQIWTDVDGILTADPRIIPRARLIERMSFREASELAFSGAKVLHPQTITPALEGNIPVRVLNSKAPDRPGTYILGDVPGDETPPHRIRAIAHKLGVRVVTIISPRMVARHGFIARIASVFDRHAVSIDMISTSEVSVSLTTEESMARLQPSIEELRTFLSVEVNDRRGQVSIVGGRLAENQKVFGEVLHTIAEIGGAIEMISYGATGTNLSLLMPEERVVPVVTALHRFYFER